MLETPALSAFLRRGGTLYSPLQLQGYLLDGLQQVHVFLVLGTPHLDTAFQVVSHEGRAEGENHLPHSAGHISFDAAQDAVGFLGWKCTLPAYPFKKTWMKDL